jgi:hypothetical protein
MDYVSGVTAFPVFFVYNTFGGAALATFGINSHMKCLANYRPEQPAAFQTNKKIDIQIFISS